MSRLRLIPRHRIWLLLIPVACAAATIGFMFWAAGLPLNPIDLWAMAMPPNPPLSALSALVGFIAWNLAPYGVLAAAMVAFGRAHRRAWSVLVAGTAIIGVGAVFALGFALGPNSSSTSGLIFLSLPVVLWVAVVVLLAVVAGLIGVSPGPTVPSRGVSLREQ